MRRAWLLGAVLLAGCGSSAAQRPASTPTPASSASSAGAKSARATIKDFTFRPGRLVVVAGARVTWVNEDTANHNVTFADKRIKTIPNLRKGQQGVITFPSAGSFSYVCTYHPGMAGTVVVQ